MDKDRFIQTIIPLRNNLLVFARKYVGNQEEAEDVVQETFAKLWVIRDRLSKYDNPAALSVTVAKNICLNRIKKENRRMSALENMGNDAIREEDDGEEREEEVKQVHAIIGRLPDLQQIVLRMKYMDEMEVEEIAQVLNCSREAVWMNLSWARKRIKELVNAPGFAEVAGVVFVELPSWKQDKLDEFFAAKTMNPELILDVMRAEQVYGWWDGGEYEFLLEVWKVNKRLPKAKKIRVVAADWQTPWDRLRSKEEVEEYHKTDKDRNGHMADVIESYLNTTPDWRSGIFTVGFAHAFRSQIPGMASSAHGKKAELTAGTQLTARLSAEKVFILFPHVKITNNGGLEDASLLRNGIFDKAFALNGNVPLAFDLAGSPFGREPFDAAGESRFDFREGSYEDNFDGYVFFGLLDAEGKECHVYDIFTDEFVSEIKRRAVIFGWEKEHFFGKPVMELTKEAIVRRLKAN